jgi:predicted RNA binding protein YcfA (HicA-like mRNA interferase family)
VYNTQVRSAEIIRQLVEDGWVLHNIRGSHHQYKHPVKPGKVTVPHPKFELPIGTVKSILKQASLTWRKK